MSFDPRLESAPPPTLSESQAATILRDYYALEGRLETQASERDQNFLLRTGDDVRHVLKIANAAEPEIVTAFQVAALLHVAKTAPTLKVPRVVPTASGETAIRIKADTGHEHTARVLTWLPGIPLSDVAPQPEIALPLGTTLAELDAALSDVEHPGSDYPLIWDMKQAHNLRPLLETVADRSLRDDLAQHLDTFENRVKPRFPELRWQVIFNDLNASNVLVEPDQPDRITGIIDFGDMIRSPLIVDVAVAAAYLVRDGDAPFGALFDFVRGFHAVTALTRLEFGLLPRLIALRNVLTIVISSWRAVRHPDNRDYLLRSQAKARRMLTMLGQRQPAEISRDLRHYCGA